MIKTWLKRMGWLTYSGKLDKTEIVIDLVMLSCFAVIFVIVAGGVR